jgi:hypothetical protein
MESARSNVWPPDVQPGILREYKDLKAEFDDHDRAFFELMDAITGLKPTRTNRLKQIADSDVSNKRFVETVKAWYLKRSRLKKALTSKALKSDAVWQNGYEGGIYSVV